MAFTGSICSKSSAGIIRDFGVVENIDTTTHELGHMYAFFKMILFIQLEYFISHQHKLQCLGLVLGMMVREIIAILGISTSCRQSGGRKRQRI